MESKKICFIQACWHKNVVDSLKHSFIESISNNGKHEVELDFVEVPGSLEIPLEAKKKVQTEQYDIVVVAGLIVDGGIYRHEFVAQSVLHSIMQIQLEFEVPIIYAVLTPQRFHGEEHEQFFIEHFKTKGIETAAACIQTLNNLAA